MQICRLVILDQQNLFLLISARITIYDIVISAQAEIDLRGIFEYIAFELQAPENASGQLDRLEACIMDLDHMPKRYRQYELEPWKSRGLRVAPVDNYLVLYILDDDTQVVTIIRVMYGGRDVNTQLNRFSAATKAAKKDLADKKAKGSFYHSDRTYADRRAAQRKRDSEYVASERQKRELMQKMTLKKRIDQKAQRQALDQRILAQNVVDQKYVQDYLLGMQESKSWNI